jgi:energy-coupling factor transporter ATP-binding protein EcfA2
MPRGIVVVGMGLPGSGKSALFAALRGILVEKSRDATVYREPEEEFWPEAVKNREQYGCIGALTWFRSMRVPNLFKADKDRNEGKIALVDSYYDKLVHLYFDHPGFRWLMPGNDPYRAVYKGLIAKDYDTLPNADCVVTITVTEERWTEYVNGRARELDRKSNLLGTFSTQDEFVGSGRKYCVEQGIPHIEFANCETPVVNSASRLYERLLEAGVIAVSG